MLFNEQYCFNNVVERTMLFTIVSTMLLNEQCCSLLFQQCCWTNNIVHYCFNNVSERTMLFTIVSTMLSMLFTIISTMLFSIDEATTRLFTIVESGHDRFHDWLQNGQYIQFFNLSYNLCYTRYRFLQLVSQQLNLLHCRWTRIKCVHAVDSQHCYLSFLVL